MQWAQVWVNLGQTPDQPAGQEVSLERGKNDIAMQYETPTRLVEIVAFGPGGSHEYSALTWVKHDPDGEDLECVDSFTDVDFLKVFDKFRAMVRAVTPAEAASNQPK